MYTREKKSVYLREERDRALFSAYTKAISENEFKSQMEAVEYARTHGAPRFYIDAGFCRNMISSILANRPIGVTGKHQVRRAAELFRRYVEIKSHPKMEGKAALTICAIIVEQPAPEFYISARSARAIIAKEKERKCRELQERMSRLSH